MYGSDKTKTNRVVEMTLSVEFTWRPVEHLAIVEQTCVELVELGAHLFSLFSCAGHLTVTKHMQTSSHTHSHVRSEELCRVEDFTRI